MSFGPACKMEEEVTGPAAAEGVETTVGIDDQGAVVQKGQIAMFPATHPERTRRVLGAFVLEQMERMFNAMESVFHRSRITEGK